MQPQPSQTPSFNLRNVLTDSRVVESGFQSYLEMAARQQSKLSGFSMKWVSQGTLTVCPRREQGDRVLVVSLIYGIPGSPDGNIQHQLKFGLVFEQLPSGYRDALAGCISQLGGTPAPAVSGASSSYVPIKPLRLPALSVSGVGERSFECRSTGVEYTMMPARVLRQSEEAALPFSKLTANLLNPSGARPASIEVPVEYLPRELQTYMKAASSPLGGKTDMLHYLWRYCDSIVFCARLFQKLPGGVRQEVPSAVRYDALQDDTIAPGRRIIVLSVGVTPQGEPIGNPLSLFDELVACANKRYYIEQFYGSQLSGHNKLGTSGMEILNGAADKARLSALQQLYSSNAVSTGQRYLIEDRLHTLSGRAAMSSTLYV